MTFEFTDRYDEQTERRMRAVYETLSEKDRRRYAAVEAQKLGHGGNKYIAEVLGCSRMTISRGLDELDLLPDDDPAEGRQRRPGGGRKPKIEDDPQTHENLCSLLEVHLAGDPEDETRVWTDRSLPELSALLDELGTPLSPPTIGCWLHEHDIKLRKMAKVIPGGESPDRNEQFEHIAELREQFRRAGNPVFSLDTKAKERLGRLYREGRAWTSGPFYAFDHDFPHWADGVLIPHGIYDLRRNHGHLNLGLSHDTSEFVCDSFYWYWRRIGRFHYSRASEILWLCDSGGSNNCRHHIFKQDLAELSGWLGLPIRVAHYPSYCSKFNPIERRFFPHVSRACAGMLFESLSEVEALMRKTATSTGLSTTVHTIKRVYERGRRVMENLYEKIPLTFDSVLPKWNYTAYPA
jgi:hypothetical protein